MLVSYEYYRFFYEVARCGSFTRAANALHSSQPNVTRTVRRLEAALGCRLFERSNRGVQLTPEGERLCARVAVACEQLEAGESDLLSAVRLQGGTVFLGATETALRGFLIEKLAGFHRLHPAVRLKIKSCTTPQALAALRRGEIELGVVTTPAETAAPLKRIELRRFRDILIAAANLPPPQHPLTLAELQRQPLILMGKGTGTHELYSALYQRQGLSLQADIEVETSDLLLPMVEQGLGVGFLPDLFARQALAQGRVRELPSAFSLPARSICAVYDGGRSAGAAAAALLRFLRGDGPQGA